jgi:hypothetical protein
MVEVPQSLITRLQSAALKVINAFTLNPINDEFFDASPTGTSKNLDSPTVEAGRIEIITSIAGLPSTNAGDKISIGVVSGGAEYWHTINSSPTADETVRFSGQLILSEGMFVRVKFEYTTAPTELKMVRSGWWVSQ